MKAFAVIPGLVVLVSLCGSPVPPPPGTVSGAVFFDANRNGARDSCDSPLGNVQVVVNGADGANGSARTNSQGEFKVEDAPVGDGTVTLFASERYVWPITTGEQRVRVESLKGVTGVSIGSASRAAFDATRIMITGIMFDDANENGEVDPDECPISPRVSSIDLRSGDRIALIDDNGAFDVKNLPEGHTRSVTAGVSVDPFGGGGLRPLHPTNGEPADEPCKSVFPAKPRYGPNIFEALLGYTLGGTSTISGVVFQDLDEDGLRDGNEPHVSGAWVRFYSTGECRGYLGESADRSDNSGKFEVSGLSRGEYIPWIDVNPVSDSFDAFITLHQELGKITVGDHPILVLDLPAKIGPPGSLRVSIFDDDNGSGDWDTGEGAVPGASVCAYMDSPSNPYPGSPLFNYGHQYCGTTGTDGIAVMKHVPEGFYTVLMGEPLPGQESSPGPLPVRVPGGQETQLAVPLSLLTPAEQVLQPSEGSRTELQVCYSDPSWPIPEFDSRWNQEIRQQTGYEEATARLVYNHPVHHFNFGESYVWSRIAGFPLDSLQPECAIQHGAGYLLTGYEPIDARTSGRVSQVRLRHTGRGVQWILLPNAYAGEGGPVHLFVDETDVPIVRCGYVCDWNDGTRPYLSEDDADY